jgi:hypothetical protein
VRIGKKSHIIHDVIAGEYRSVALERVQDLSQKFAHLFIHGQMIDDESHTADNSAHEAN